VEIASDPQIISEEAWRRIPLRVQRPEGRIRGGRAGKIAAPVREFQGRATLRRVRGDLCEEETGAQPAQVIRLDPDESARWTTCSWGENEPAAVLLKSKGPFR
jgi:hypothetical protein